MSIAISFSAGDDINFFKCGNDGVWGECNHWDGDDVGGIVWFGEGRWSSCGALSVVCGGDVWRLFEVRWMGVVR